MFCTVLHLKARSCVLSLMILRPNADLRRQQNLQRRKYAVAAGRERRGQQDNQAKGAWTQHHWAEAHMKGSSLADYEAGRALFRRKSTSRK